MKYLYSWLKQFYPAVPPLSELEPLLVQIGHDVESVEPLQYPGVVVGVINSIAQHPHADRLSVAEVSDGKTTYTVVCGAPNLQVGQKAPLAVAGTTLPSGIPFRKATIRGVDSEGMLLAEDELGYGPSHESLVALPDNAQPGEPVNNYFHDAIIALDITSDRGDVLSHFGLARDIKSALGHDGLTPQFKTPHYSGQTSQHVTITGVHRDARALSLGLAESKSPGVTPLYMQCRLQLLGQKSINLATDITNYLLLEFGQPLHAYDADILGEPINLGVRRARPGESFNGLNGKNYQLSAQSLVITSHDKPVALAGVLGGEATKVTAKTTRVLFESAHFYPKPILIMARGLNCLTDSALRWERGVDFNLMAPMLAHAQALYAHHTDGQVYEPIIKQNPLIEKIEPLSLAIPPMNQFIGTNFDQNTVGTLLRGSGVEVKVIDSKDLTVLPPPWRQDLLLPVDYYEEVVRLYGLDNLTKKPLPASVPQWKRSKYWRQEQLKDTLVNLAGHEIDSYPFMSQSELDYFPHKDAVTLSFMIQDNKQYMRTSLVPGMLQALASNPEMPFLVLYEVSRIYIGNDEPEMLCVGIAGSSQTESDDWWRNLFERLRVPVASWMTRVQSVNDELKNFYKIRKPVVSVLSLPVGDIISAKHYETPTAFIPDLDAIGYNPVSRYQASRRDVAFVADSAIKPKQVIQDLHQLDPSIVDVILFDTYTDNKLGVDKHSLAFHILYQSPDKTLTQDEIGQLHHQVEDYIKEQYHGTIR